MDEMMATPAPMDGMDSIKQIFGDFNIIIPTPFSMSDPDLKPGFDKLMAEATEKVDQWETQMSGMFGEYEESYDSWLIQSSKQANRHKALFNSKSGETHRPVVTRP